MPELPEVETTCRGIAPEVTNKTIAAFTIRNGRLRWPVPEHLASTLVGLTITSVTRRGKYLLLRCEKNGELIGVLMVHLGMSGSLRLTDPTAPLKTHDHLVWRFQGSALELRYHDPRRFGSCLWLEGQEAEYPESHPLLSLLGPEPLSSDFNDRWLHRLSRNKSQAIKSFIMDSHVVVGVGNIYANEALFLSGIHPLRAAGRISLARYHTLTHTIRQVLAAAIEQGGTTLRDFVNGQGEPGYFQQTLHVYGRAGLPCTHCKQPLTEVRVTGRSTVFCTQCQH